MANPTTVRDWLHQAAADAADRTAVEYLLAEHLGIPRLELALHLHAPADIQAAYHRLTVENEPLQYILGHTEFHGLHIRCDRRALIPRPETESLVNLALPLVNDRTRIIEIGTGTGCIAIALAKLSKPASILALDISPQALDLAAENARHHQANITFQQGDLLTGIPPQSADLIIANLPYIPSATIPTLHANVRDHEPHLALDGGPNGLDLIARLAEQATTTLSPNGHLLLEIDESHPTQAATTLKNLGYENTTLHQDFANRPRFLTAER